MVIEFRLDRRSGVPPYLQLVGQVREALRLGLLRPGDRLPTVREVVAASGVNPNTVLKAYRELGLSGLVETRPGAGTFICGSLGSADPKLILKLRAQLTHWVDGARNAGLEDDDIRAVMASVLGDPVTRRAGGVA